MGNSTNSHSQLSIFDELDSETKDTVERIESEVRAWMSEIVPCHFCGERMNRAVMPWNHGIVFNGWCMKALALLTRNRKQLHTEDARWLESKDIDPKCDRFDKSVWRPALIEQHFDTHFFSCYRVEECK